MLQGHQRKDAGLILAYFSRIQVCECGREGWMGISILSFDGAIQCNIAVGFTLEDDGSLALHRHCDGGCTRLLPPQPEGSFWKSLGKNWYGHLSESNWANYDSFFPALKVSYDFCWAAAVRLCFGEQASVSTGTQPCSLWKAQLTDIM